MADHSKMKLGKLKAHHDKRLPMLNRYTGKLPAPPAAQNWSHKLTHLGMMLNDTLGDCTCAAIGHCVQEWTSLTDPEEVILPDATILKLYEAVSGYIPGRPNTDVGAVVADVLNYWLNDPGAVGGHSLPAYAAVEPNNRQEIQDAVYIFGNCYIGLQMPISAQTQAVWSVPPGGPVGQGAPGSWGGHAVPVVAYDARGLTVITWGQLLRMTWPFLDAYCDEAYALIGQDWLSSGKCPPGFKLSQHRYA